MSRCRCGWALVALLAAGRMDEAESRCSDTHAASSGARPVSGAAEL